MMKKVLVFLAFIGLVLFDVQSQIYPVSGNVIMPYPSPIFLSEYSAPGSSKLQLNITLNDFTVPSHDVKLKFNISNGGVELATMNSYLPLAPITLTPGVPVLLQGSDLYDGLNLNNLNLSGINQAYLTQNGGKLPEGQYDFCIEVLDYQSGEPLSLPICTSVFLQLDPAPILMSPTCADNIMPSNPQQIMFNWQLTNAVQGGVGINTFRFFLYEITDPDIQDPQNAVVNSKAVSIYTADNIMQNMLNLDFGTVLLVPGKKYVYRVQAVAPNGTSETFVNDGFSEWCWFTYGFESGGTIELTAPADLHQFSKGENKVFSWDVSDKGVNGQPYDYKISIVQMPDTTQSLADALTNNPNYFQETLPTTTQQDGGSFILSEELESDMKYAWKIEAFSVGQKVAESEPSSFFSHGLIDYFYAANQKIKVIQAYNKDLSNLSGKCRIQLSEDEQDFVDVEFENLDIEEVTGQFILNNGQVDFDLSGRDLRTLIPVIEKNGEASFLYEAGVINPDGLKYLGKVKWEFPHLSVDGEVVEMISKSGEFMMDSDWNLSGEIGFEPFSIEFLNPNDFKFDLFESTSYVALTSNGYRLFLKGKFTLPESIVSSSGGRVEIELKDHVNQLDYIELGMVFVNEPIQPFAEINLTILPESNGVIDFSEDKSPSGLIGGESAWKGVYFDQSTVTVTNSNFDGSNQFVPQKQVKSELLATNGDQFYVDNNNLTLKTSIIDVEGKYNTFPTNAKVVLDIKEGDYSNNLIEGEIVIPFISSNEAYPFEIKLKEEEIAEQGFLKTDFSGKQFAFNADGGENKIDFTINNAVFADNDHVSMNVDLNWNALDLTVEGIDGFSIYGDNNIGIEKRGGSVVLAEPSNGKVMGIPLEVREIGASYDGKDYAVSYIGFLNLGNTITGQDDGSPSYRGGSVAKIDSKFANSNPSYDYGVADIVPLKKSDMRDLSKVLVTSIPIKVKSGIADAEGKLEFLDNDPEWGARFEAKMDVVLKFPRRIECGGGFLYGRKGETDYWYADVYYEDINGKGILVDKTIPKFRTVGLEGRIYHHMALNKQGDQGNFEVEEDIVFGQAGYMQVIDYQTSGFLMQSDIGVLYEAISDGDGGIQKFNQSYSVQSSFLNLKNVRKNETSSPNIDVPGFELPDVNAPDFPGNLMDFDLSFVDFSGVDFIGVDISGLLDVADIKFPYIPEMDVSMFDLSEIDFTGFDFSGINMDLSMIDFSELDFIGADISELLDMGEVMLPYIPEMDVSMFDLSLIDFTGFDFSGINMDLSMIDFSGLDFIGADISGLLDVGEIKLPYIPEMDVSMFDLSLIDFTGFDFTGLNMDLSMIDFSGLDFIDIDLSGLDLSSINVPYVPGMDLSMFDLSAVDFTGFDFAGFNVDLSMIDFSGLGFQGVNITDWTTDLMRVPYVPEMDVSMFDLSGIDFTGFDFAGFNVDLSMIDFTGLSFEGINIADWTTDLMRVPYVPEMDLSMFDLSGIDFEGFDFAGFNVDLSMIDFTGLSFEGIDITNWVQDLITVPYLPGMDVSMFDLSKIDFTGFDFSSIDVDISMVDFALARGKGRQETGTVAMDGPQNIRTISLDADGWAFGDVQADVKIDVNTPANSSFSGKGTVQTGLNFPILKTADVTPFTYNCNNGGFKFTLASEGTPAKMYVYGDKGPNVKAFAVLKGTEEGVDVKFGFKNKVSFGDSYSKSYGVGDASCTFKAHYSYSHNLDIRGDFFIATSGTPTFNDGTVDINASVSVGASGCGVGGSVGATVKGTLSVKTQEGGKTNLSGKAKASATIMGYTASFSKNVNLTL